ncbi:MAG: hypothetical protein HY600_04290 [Candidatus Omnitrophica bacterium]|nr:hypothetical protein [Candidatus Omnitrophota bacterium]
MVLALWVAGAAPLAWAADGVPLDQVPPLPERTLLFRAEQTFGERGKIGGFALKPSKYGAYEDDRVWFRGPGGEPPPHEAWRFQYKKAPGIPFCGTYVMILGDLSRYSTLTFWVKGQRGGEAFEIGLNDTISNKREDAVFAGSIYRYLPRGVTTAWQQVVVPLEDFFGPDLSRVYSLVFNYNEEGSGAFWVDGLAFHRAVLVDRAAQIERQGYLVVDNFDHSDLNLLGRKTNAFKRLPSTCAVARVPAARHGAEGRGLRLTYQKEAAGWCGYYTLLNQIDGDYFDATPYKAVSFLVRGGAGRETFEIGMADKNWQTIGDSVKAGPVEKYLPRGVTTAWQEVVIPLADFGKLDFPQMGSLVINFHQQGRGILDVDDVLLIRKTEQELLQEWDD